MSPVFRHGQLRLYLLSVLADRPLTGYDIMKELEQRFAGAYSPSAGTIYPRLAKLADEGLVTRADEGRTAVYTITDAGRAEVAGRAEEVERIDSGIDSAAAVAEAARESVRSATADLKREIGDAAARSRTPSRGEPRSSEGGDHGAGGSAHLRSLRALERTLRGLDREVRALERAALRAARGGPQEAEAAEALVAQVEAQVAAATARLEDGPHS